MSKLSALLALATGRQKKICDDFLSQFFSIIEEELRKGESVRIKGFGTFKLAEMEQRKSVDVSTGEDTMIPRHTRVLFVAAKELAARVNKAFEAFEATEISDDVTTDSLSSDIIGDDETFLSTEEYSIEEESDTRGNTSDHIAQDAAEYEIPEEIPFSQDLSAVEKLKDGDMSPEDSSMETETLETESVQETMDDDMTREAYSGEGDYEEYSHQDERRGKYLKGFLSGFACAVVLMGLVVAAGYYLGYDFGLLKKKFVQANEEKENILQNTSEKSIDSADVAISVAGDDVSEEMSNKYAGSQDVPTKASDEVVYDTVSTTRYLTTIAKEHYGNFNLWPIIYEENKAILGHPDRIRPGTRVVVPSLSKYGVDPKDPEQIKKIKQQGVAIYARYK